MSNQARAVEDDFTLPVVNLIKAGLYGGATWWLLTRSFIVFELLPLIGLWTGYQTAKQFVSAVINAHGLKEHDRKVNGFRKRMQELSTSAMATFRDVASSKNLSFVSGIYFGVVKFPKKKAKRLFGGRRYHVSIVAPPGMQKTMAIVVPTILQWTRKMGHLLINDPSGEILSICAPYLRSLGFTIVVICPFMREINRLIGAKVPWTDGRLDIFSALEDPDLTMSQIRPLLMEAAQWMVPDQPNDSKHDFFPEEAREIAVWLAMHDLRNGRHPGLVSMRKTLMQAHALKELLHDASDEHEWFDGAYAEMAATLWATATDAPPQFSGGVSTLRQVISKFDDYSDLGKHVGEPTYHLGDLADKSRRFAYFVCYPPEKADKFSKQLSMTLSYLLDSIAAVNSKVPTTAILDEVGALRFPLAQKLNQYRKLGLRCLMIWQDLKGQALKNFGAAETNQIMAASHAKAFLGVTEPETLKMAETYCGTMVTDQSTLNNTQGDKKKLIDMGSSQSMQRVPVMPGDEIRLMPDDKLLLVVGNDKPVIVTKTPYWDLPDLAKKAGPSPYHLEDPDDA